ncbi:MAG: gliding motility-associated C-terminal domain-containing protein, partial [Bacteroidetes bacterium]|nr:gliding motility-associated C-terminal domain-containing protein [Bacteroidota bacterium]
GEKVFETTDPKIGWDGNFHQNPCAAGVYTYIIKATGNEGKQISLSGSLHLIR